MRAKIVIYRSGVERLIDDVNMKTEITLYRSVIENLMDEMSTKETSEYANGRLDLLKALLLLFDEEGQ
jgi:hypothetical protein